MNVDWSHFASEVRVVGRAIHAWKRTSAFLLKAVQSDGRHLRGRSARCSEAGNFGEMAIWGGGDINGTRPV